MIKFEIKKVKRLIIWGGGSTWAQFRSRKFCKRTVDSPSHRIFGRMHKALNIDKK
jgi:hypothetical protein